MLTLLVMLIVAAVLFWAVRTLLPVFGVPSQVQTVVEVIFVVIIVLWLLSLFVPMPGMLRLR